MLLSDGGGDKTTDTLIDLCVCVCVYLRQQNINHLNIRCHNICVSQEKIHAIDWQGAAVSHSDWWTCQPLAVKVKVGGARGSATLQLHDWSVVCGHRHLSLSSYINLQFLQVGVNVRGKSNQQPNLPRIKCRADFKQIYRKSEKYKSSHPLLPPCWWKATGSFIVLKTFLDLYRKNSVAEFC